MGLTQDVGTADEERPATPRRQAFESILFRSGRPEEANAEQPACFRDLNLDQVVEAVVVGRDEYGLTPFFYLPLRSVEDVAYRHEVFHDLESEDVRRTLKAFGEQMHRVRSFLTLARKQHYAPEKRRWFLDAASGYCSAVVDLTRGLRELEPSSEALRLASEYLDDYVAGESFTSLDADADAVRAGLDEVIYTLRINGSRVSVARYDDQPDFGDEIEDLFERFRQGQVESHRLKVPDRGSMDHVEAQIASLVARLFPREFEALETFCSRHEGFLDRTVTAFDREAQFYLAWADHIERISATGGAFSCPSVSDESKAETVEDAFDLALAAKVGREQGQLVRNGFRLDGDERLLVVTGPNQGGKTTFARMFGQLHYLASLGVPVPARSARLFLADRVFTHFEREEVVGSLRGKLDDELIRIRDLLQEATPRSVVVLNEMFSSATLADALDLGTDILTQLIERGCLGVCVTFIDELSRLGDATVSMVAQVSPDDPAVRTYRVIERPADGRAYAWAIAKKYGLSYDQLRERLAP